MRVSVAIVVLLAALAAAAPRDDVSSEEVAPAVDMSRKKTTTTKEPSTPTVSTTTTEEPVVTELPPFRGDYERLENFGYYKIYNTHSSWWNAWQTCFLEGSHLLILRSPEERKALQAWKPYYQVPGYSWYGAHHRFRDHQFVTLFDTPLADTGYSKFVEDYSNRTYYNNVDWPDMIVLLHPTKVDGDGLLLVRARSSYFFICKLDI